MFQYLKMCVFFTQKLFGTASKSHMKKWFMAISNRGSPSFISPFFVLEFLFLRSPHDKSPHALPSLRQLDLSFLMYFAGETRDRTRVRCIAQYSQSVLVLSSPSEAVVSVKKINPTKESAPLDSFYD